MSYYSTKIQSLSEEARKIICFIAYYEKNIPFKKLEKYAKAEGIKKETLEECLQKFSADGICDNNYSFLLGGKGYFIQPFWFLPALKYLLTERPEWIDRIENYDIVRDAVIAKLQHVAFEYFKNKKKKIKCQCTSFQFYTFYPYLYSAAFDCELHPLINILPLDCIGLYFEYVMVDRFYADVVTEDNAIQTLLKSYDYLPADQYQEIQELVALYRYYSIGEYKPLPKGKSVYHLILLGVRCLHQKQYPEAGKYLEKALKIRNKGTKVKNVFMNVLTCYFLIAYYRHHPTDKNKKSLEQFCKKMEISHEERFWPAYVVARYVGEKHAIESRMLQGILNIGKEVNNRVYRAMGNYLASVLEEPVDKELITEYMPSQAVFMHEFQQFLPLDEQKRKELNDKFGTPILFPEPPMPRWEQILTDLVKKEEEKEEETENQPKKERLAYIIQYDHLLVREQARKLNGLWGAGKNIAASRYFDGNIECMDETDRQIWLSHGKRLEHLKIESVLPFLAGTDRVFKGYQAPFAQVTVEEEKPYLIVDNTKNQFVVSSNLPRLREKLCYVVEKSPTSYSVIRLTSKQKVIFERLLDVKTFPLEAEEKLKEALSVLGKSIQIHSPLFEDEHSLETVKGTGTIAVQITKLTNYKFNIHLVARPLDGGKDVFYPGYGESVVITENAEGKKMRVKRSLKAEEANMEALNTFIEELLEGFVYDRNGDASTWTLGMYFMLDLLEYLGEHADIYSIEWPEGERIGLRKIPEKKEWNLELKSKGGGWFELEGEVQIDEDTVMDIAQLLQKIAQSGSSKFIALSESEYLKLTSDMRKKLAYLEALSVKEKNQLRIPKMNALLLNETFEGDLMTKRNEQLQETVEKIKESYNLNPRTPRNLQATLRDYQLEGFRWMVRLDSWGAGACLADDMGLGKTIQTIALLLYKAKQGPSLVVAPTSVVSNWKNELSRFAPTLRVTLLNELSSDDRIKAVKEAEAFDVVLSSYGIVCSECETLNEKEWNVICLDEAHAIKNRESKTALQIYNLKGSTRIALTGTPLQNHLGELWSLFNFINPGMMGTYEVFRQKFVLPIESGNKERQKQLRRMILPFILRRTKSEVVEELPDKTEIQCRVSLSAEEMNTYELIRSRAEQRLDEEEKVSVAVLAEITKLRQAACASSLVDEKLTFPSSKIERLVELVNEISEGNNRVLIFSQFTSFLKMVKDRFDEEKMEYLYLDGSTPLKQREKLVRSFQEGDAGIFIISLKAGGLGLNLTGANYVIHMDPWWNPAIEQQATDRAYRIGQNQNVTVYHLIAEHTIEDKILRLHKTKRDMADSLLEGADMGHKLTEEDLRDLLAR